MALCLLSPEILVSASGSCRLVDFTCALSLRGFSCFRTSHVVPYWVRPWVVHFRCMASVSFAPFTMCRRSDRAVVFTRTPFISGASHVNCCDIHRTPFISGASPRLRLLSLPFLSFHFVAGEFTDARDYTSMSFVSE